MELHKLSFCKIKKLSDSIAEVIVHEGKEVDLEMVAEYHQWITENLSAPCGLLINKVNKYAYAFEAQLKIADLPKIRAVAVIAYNRISAVSSLALTKLPGQEQWNIKMFSDRTDGLEWLEGELDK